MDDMPPELEERWQESAKERQAIAEALAARRPPRTVPNRVNQLEALELDAELTEMLSDQFKRVFAFFRPGLLQDLKPESDALFGFVIAFFSICSGSQTPGNVFQNLVYVDRARTHLPSSRLAPPVRRQRIGYLLLFVVLPYIWARGSRVVERREWGARPEGEWRRRAWVLMQRLEAWYRCAATVNLVLFLRFTTYRTIGERLLRIGLEPQDATLTRTLNFEYTNQVLVWHTMQDILAQSRPFIAVALPKARAALASMYASIFTRGGASREDQERARLLPAGACGFCALYPPCSPHVGECGHPFCYFCLKSAQATGGGVKCPRCKATLRTCSREPVSSISDVSVDAPIS